MEERLSEVTRLSGGRSRSWYAIGAVWVLVASVFSTSAAAASDATIVAVGAVYGARKSNGPGVETDPLILRNGKGDWERVLTPAVSGQLQHLAFAGSVDVWAAGGSGTGPLLLHSGDGGLTWEDATARLPADVRNHQRLRGLVFVDQHTGWVVSETIAGIGPYVSSTVNGGESWTIRAFSAKGLSLLYTVSTSGADALLMQSDGEESSFRSLDVAHQGKEFMPASHPLMQAAAVASVGTKRWIAGARSRSAEAVNDIPSVMSLASDGTWSEQWIPARSAAELRSIHFANLTDGLAGGVSLGEKVAPLIFHTHDGGSQWQEGRLPDDLNGMQVSSVLRMAGSQAWMATNNGSGAGTALLHSDDAGETWSRVATGVDAVGHVYALGQAD